MRGKYIHLVPSSKVTARDKEVTTIRVSRRNDECLWLGKAKSMLDA